MYTWRKREVLADLPAHPLTARQLTGASIAAAPALLAAGEDGG